MHDTPISGYMGEYKTLYRIKLRFFWPRLRYDVKDWINNAPIVCSPIIGDVKDKNLYIFGQ